MEVVLVMFKDDERRDFPLKSKTAIVGRRLDCDLRIPTKDVSRQHCEIQVKGVEVLIKDLGSSNGTFINGKRVAESYVKPGDRVTVGPVTFIARIDGEPAKITPHDARVEFEEPPTPPKPKAAAKKPPREDEETVLEIGEDEIFDLTEDEFDLDSIELLEDDDDEDMP